MYKLMGAGVVQSSSKTGRRLILVDSLKALLGASHERP
jgi:hypothetical protein